MAHYFRFVVVVVVAARLVAVRFAAARLVAAQLVAARLVAVRFAAARLVAARLVSARLVSARLAAATVGSVARLVAATLDFVDLVDFARFVAANLVAARFDLAHVAVAFGARVYNVYVAFSTRVVVAGYRAEVGIVGNRVPFQFDFVLAAALTESYPTLYNCKNEHKNDDLV